MRTCHKLHNFLSNSIYLETELDEIHSDRNLAANIYGLLTIPVFAFFVYILCIVMNYARIRAVEYTWLESHFYWQINTCLVSLIIYVPGLILALILRNFDAWLFANFLRYIWVIYRVIKGYIALRKMNALTI